MSTRPARSIIRGRDCRIHLIDLGAVNLVMMAVPLPSVTRVLVVFVIIIVIKRSRDDGAGGLHAGNGDSADGRHRKGNNRATAGHETQKEAKKQWQFHGGTFHPWIRSNEPARLSSP